MVTFLPQKDWIKTRLGNIALEIRKLYEPNENEDLPYIGLEHIEQQTLRLVKVGRSSAVVSSKKVFEKGDILFGSLRPYFRKVIRPTFSGVCSTDITVVRAKEKTDVAFLFYLMASQNFISHATNISLGTRMPRASWKVLRESEWCLPSLLTQHKISAILSAYDNLIENNLRRIKILEEMAQALYREWFVHFRFPGHEKVHFIDSPLGEIPEGWKEKELADVCFLTMGQSPKSKYYNTDGTGLPFHQGVAYFGNRFPKERLYCSVMERIAEKGDILFSVRAPVGRINIADRKIIIGRGLCAIRHKAHSQWYIFHLLKDLFIEEDIIGGGTIFKSVTKNDMEQIKLLIPTDFLMAKFDHIVRPLEKQIENLTEKNATLRSIRDLLLPKLISGELDVSALDIDVSDVS